MARPKGKIAKLLAQYVCVRITDMTHVDIGLFNFDPNSTLYCFVLNSDEQVYLRYGGRDDASADTYLNEESLALALERGLAEHRRRKLARMPAENRPAAAFPKDIPEVRDNQIAKKQCVHCHQLGHGRARLLQSQGKIDKLRDVWHYPELATLGIELDPEKGTVVKKAEGPAKEAGMKGRDEIIKVRNTVVRTYGDLQQQVHETPLDAEALDLTVRRGTEDVAVSVKLFEWWRVTNIERRSSTHALEPFPEFWAKPLTEAEKRKHNIKPAEFGAAVTKFWVKTNGQAAGLQIGDIVFEVDGVSTAVYTSSPTLWIRLNRKAGDTVKVKVIRGDKRLEFSFKLKARPW